jgi:hypothetical protein
MRRPSSSSSGRSAWAGTRPDGSARTSSRPIQATGKGGRGGINRSRRGPPCPRPKADFMARRAAWRNLRDTGNPAGRGSQSPGAVPTFCVQRRPQSEQGDRCVLHRPVADHRLSETIDKELGEPVFRSRSATAAGPRPLREIRLYRNPPGSDHDSGRPDGPLRRWESGALGQAVNGGARTRRSLRPVRVTDDGRAPWAEDGRMRARR